ncbi:hypothetical protein [Nocardia sp. NPDC051463]
MAERYPSAAEEFDLTAQWAEPLWPNALSDRYGHVAVKPAAARG